MMEIIRIRTQPMPKPTKHNAEYRQALSKAKLQVALKVPQTEREPAHTGIDGSICQGADENGAGIRG